VIVLPHRDHLDALVWLMDRGLPTEEVLAEMRAAYWP
jgi:hypothetical protein